MQLKIIVAPDKFKGSLTSFEVCMAIHQGIEEAGIDADVLQFPMADGGDGFAKVMKYYLKTNTEQCPSVDALGRAIHSSYEMNQEKGEAIIELATCSGLAMLKKEERNPMITSTFGTGLQIRHAIEKGCRSIVLGLGGSATNDAGTGILEALGFTFYDRSNIIVKPCGETLLSIEGILPPQNLPSVKFLIACDVNNPLYGPEGAAYVFSPQKGANEEQVSVLDRGLRHISKVLAGETGKDFSSLPGTGAAGGIAVGLMSYFDVTLAEGTQMIIDASGIATQVTGADKVITGEGKIDHQSSRGKIVSAITRLAKTNHVPVLGVCGKLDLSPEEYHELGLDAVVAISEPSMSEEYAMTHAFDLLKKRIAHVKL